MSRYIPKTISDKVHQIHFFECAWCCEKLTERHHIKEFSKGGKHSIENLILLCPNCHNQVHNNEISEAEISKRKSTHLKGDRLSGGIQFDINNLIIKLGNNFFENVPNLIEVNGENILGLKKLNNNILLNCRFYNKEGFLIFWMSSNRYWATSDFIIKSKKNEIIIHNIKDDNCILKMWVEEEKVNVEGKNFINGLVIEFSPTLLNFNSPEFIQMYNNCTFKDIPTAINIIR